MNAIPEPPGGPSIELLREEIIAMSKEGVSLPEMVDPLVSMALQYKCTKDLLRFGARELAAATLARMRRTIERGRVEDDRDPAEWSISEKAMSRLQGELRVRLTGFNYPLPGGKQIGDATVDDLVGAADFYRRQKDGMARQEAMYDRFAKILRKSRKEKLRDAISEDECWNIILGATS